ncbi:MAG: integration host factor subunit beta [Treponema sp.]|jgi:integration host factor subunit beta|nr:integration host factor subunit beta [Treponema sp.]
MAEEKYTKAEIVDSIYQKTGFSRKDIREIIELFIEEIKNALIKKMVIELRGFGTFGIKIRKGRKIARNPKTGETLQVHSHGIAAFKAGRELKQAVWNVNTETIKETLNTEGAGTENAPAGPGEGPDESGL